MSMIEKDVKKKKEEATTVLVGHVPTQELSPPSTSRDLTRRRDSVGSDASVEHSEHSDASPTHSGSASAQTSPKQTPRSADAQPPQALLFPYTFSADPEHSDSENSSGSDITPHLEPNIPRLEFGGPSTKTFITPGTDRPENPEDQEGFIDSLDSARTRFILPKQATTTINSLYDPSPMPVENPAGDGSTRSILEIDMLREMPPSLIVDADKKVWIEDTLIPTSTPGSAVPTAIPAPIVYYGKSASVTSSVSISAIAGPNKVPTQR